MFLAKMMDFAYLCAAVTQQISIIREEEKHTVLTLSVVTQVSTLDKWRMKYGAQWEFLQH